MNTETIAHPSVAKVDLCCMGGVRRAIAWASLLLFFVGSEVRRGRERDGNWVHMTLTPSLFGRAWREKGTRKSVSPHVSSWVSSSLPSCSPWFRRLPFGVPSAALPPTVSRRFLGTHCCESTPFRFFCLRAPAPWKWSAERVVNFISSQIFFETHSKRVL